MYTPHVFNFLHEAIGHSRYFIPHFSHKLYNDLVEILQKKDEKITTKLVVLSVTLLKIVNLTLLFIDLSPVVDGKLHVKCLSKLTVYRKNLYTSYKYKFLKFCFILH